MNNRMDLVGAFVALLLLLIIPFLWAADEGVTRQEIAKLAKPATVLVETTAGFGSGFCIHPSGLFITNEHVVSSLPDGSTITLVLDAGLQTQQKLKAQVVRRDKELDLALLRATGEHKLPALSLGSDERLAELTELIAFGFPFGKALAKPGEYPTLSINVGNVSSLRRDAKRDLHRIQLDAVLNPGNSGGPVLDRSGKVVGVVVSGISGAGINLAIPVSHVNRFLARPEIVFTAPIIHLKDKHELVEFKATVISLTAPDARLELELILTNHGESERRFEMKTSGSSFAAKAAPFPVSKNTATLRLEVKYNDGLVTGAVEDRTVSIGKQTFQLSEIRRLRFGSSPEVLLTSGKKVEGLLSDFDVISLKVGGQALELKLTSAVEVGIAAIPESNTVTCTVVARQAGKELGRYAALVSLQGTEKTIRQAHRAEAIAKDLKALAGKWQADHIELSDLASADPERLGALFDEHELIITLDGKKNRSARVTLDPTQDPKAIDILWTSGAASGNTSLGIYRFLEDGTLEICWNPPRGKGSDKRPKLFTTKVELGAGSVRYVLKRP